MNIAHESAAENRQIQSFTGTLAKSLPSQELSGEKDALENQLQTAQTEVKTLNETNERLQSRMQEQQQTYEQQLSSAHQEITLLQEQADAASTEIAELLSVTTRTIRNDWTRAKAWLLEAMRAPDQPQP